MSLTMCINLGVLVDKCLQASKISNLGIVKLYLLVHGDQTLDSFRSYFQGSISDLSLLLYCSQFGSPDLQ